MDMKKVSFVVLVAAVCMTAVMADSKQPQPVSALDVPPKTGDPAPAPKTTKASHEATPSPSPATETPTGTQEPIHLPGDAAAPAPHNSANTVVGSLAGASLLSFLALYM